ncbi:hypothetical protein LTR10_018236 [Elasticomyces elasticus]|uniref:Major facilitator superfamily (MFS) profile domain-containing protein n=1 Tax=Exophiala sideris TaxID=1016849 RepID=A0ABR0JIX1_9EURO|nr:hypothetical protein LTR10_018236 [Elasticomyces elasticus]KAK5034523.1 hypothetical protein LTS07_003444 [Exophiala sideris]KAK5042819.1 hypothetical protein LTR13_001667 [Exophiala sideris]KAK5065902.1 hypothetical protein LTR69_003452 [Exophiala sideris]KAK5185636.1 hypothetical protein LTR44_001685 [Eurotiomycetes sp. CCFEE 6388]
MARSAKFNQYLVVWFVTFGSFTYGYCSSIIATTLAQPSFITYMHLDTASNAAQLFGAVNGLFQAGGFLGSLSISMTADYLGRRKALMTGALFALVGGALQAGSVDIAMYLVMRFITGLGVGMLIVMVPLYQSEIAPPEIRGFIVSAHAIVLSVGYVVASWVGLGFYFVNAGGAQWRLPLAIQCVAPLILAAGSLWLPESPRWLIAKDRTEDALKSFRSTRGESDDPNNPGAIQAEFELIVAQINHERHNQLSIMDLLKRPSMRTRFFIGFIIMFGYQCTGTQVINNYGPELYKSLGFNTVQQLLIQGGWISTCPLMNIVCMFVIDRLGRTKLMMTGFLAIVAALVGECATVAVFQNTGHRGAAAGAVVFLFMHVLCTTFFIDGVTYVYATEIFPTPQRAKGAAFALSGQYCATIIFLSSAPLAFQNIDWKYYLVFVVLSLGMFFVVLLTFPETKNKTLEELSAVFGDSVEGLTRQEEDELYRERGHHKDHHPDAIVLDDKTPARHLEVTSDKM